MHFINTGNSFYIFPGGSTTGDALPAQMYKICFSKSTGLYLETIGEPPVLTEKVYGNHAAKISKVMRTFDKMNRSLGGTPLWKQRHREVAGGENGNESGG